MSMFDLQHITLNEWLRPGSLFTYPSRAVEVENEKLKEKINKVEQERHGDQVTNLEKQLGDLTVSPSSSEWEYQNIIT